MIYVKNDRCDFCGACVAVCPVDAIDLFEARIFINQHCIDCMLCVWICPVETLAPATVNTEIECGQAMTA
ncbi:MAG: 4Fe-4S binding protein [bacterium]